MHTFIMLAASVLAGSEPASTNIQCQERSAYAGIDRVYTLTIDAKTWKYTAALTSGDEKLTASGAYELVDGLAVFTGKVNNRDEVRFGFNYAFPNGNVEFNGFFPAGNQAHQYRRRWYRQVQGEWRPAREVILNMPSRGGVGGWRVPFTGERIVWDDAGQARREKIDVKVLYRGQGEYFGLFEKPPAELADMIPPVLMPQRSGILFGMSNGPDGFLRGFRWASRERQGPE